MSKQFLHRSHRRRQTIMNCDPLDCRRARLHNANGVTPLFCPNETDNYQVVS